VVETVKVTLVTIVAAFELEERLIKDLRALGAKGYTIGKVDGRGVHGRRMAGLADAPNLRIEVLTSRSLAEKIGDRIASKYKNQPIIAFTHEVEAMPHEHFEDASASPPGGSSKKGIA
jgi:nitrogen regulatory protein P-II 2